MAFSAIKAGLKQMQNLHYLKLQVIKANTLSSE